MSEELREKIAQELFDIWKEAKETTSDRWTNIRWESLPENHQRQYFLTVDRIFALLRGSGWKSPAELQGWVQLDPAQTLPACPRFEWHDIDACETKCDFERMRQHCPLLKTGFVKVQP